MLIDRFVKGMGSIVLACFGVSAAHAVEWDLAVYVPINSAYLEPLREFAESVKIETNGDVIVTIRAPGELPYKPGEYHRAVGSGEIALADAGFFTADVTAAGVLTSIFLIQNYDEMSVAMDAVWPDIVEGLAVYGAEPLFWGAHGPSKMWGKGAPVSSVSEIAGRKVRVLAAEHGLLMNELRANPVTMATPEVMTALQYGAIDSVMTSPNGIMSSGWAGVFEWGYDLSISMMPSYIIVSKEKMAELSEENQQAVRRAVEKHKNGYFDNIRALEDKALEDIISSGVNIVPPTNEDRERLLSLAHPIWDDWVRSRGGDAGEQLKRVREALGR